MSIERCILHRCHICRQTVFNKETGVLTCKIKNFDFKNNGRGSHSYTCKSFVLLPFFEELPTNTNFIQSMSGIIPYNTLIQLYYQKEEERT